MTAWLYVGEGFAALSVKTISLDMMFPVGKIITAYVPGNAKVGRLMTYTASVKKNRKAAAGVLLAVVALSLLLFLLIPHAVQHHAAIAFFFPLVPIFLFGLIALREISTFWFSALYLPLDPANSRPTLFQLPPPLKG